MGEQADHDERQDTSIVPGEIDADVGEPQAVTLYEANLSPQKAGTYSITSLMQVGRLLALSGYFADAREESQAVAKVLAGAELGIGPVASMTGIYIVKGKVTLSANLMAALVKQSGRYDYRVTKHTNTECEIAFTERGESLGTSVFTIDDAKRAGIVKQGSPWVSFPRNMLFARAMSNGVKLYCPDIGTMPLYSPDEFDGPLDLGPVRPTRDPATLPVPSVRFEDEDPEEAVEGEVV